MDDSVRQHRFVDCEADGGILADVVVVKSTTTTVVAVCVCVVLQCVVSSILHHQRLVGGESSCIYSTIRGKNAGVPFCYQENTNQYD